MRVSIYLLADPLPAILTLDRMLDDCIITKPRVDTRYAIQCQAYADEVEYFIQERPITVISLFDAIPTSHT